MVRIVILVAVVGLGACGDPDVRDGNFTTEGADALALIDGVTEIRGNLVITNNEDGLVEKALSLMRSTANDGGAVTEVDDGSMPPIPREPCSARA